MKNLMVKCFACLFLIASSTQAQAQVNPTEETVEVFKDIKGRDKDYVRQKFFESPEEHEYSLYYNEAQFAVFFQETRNNATAVSFFSGYRGEMPFGLNKNHIRAEDLHNLFPQVVQNRKNTSEYFCSIAESPEIKGEFEDPIRISFDADDGSFVCLRVSLFELFKIQNSVKPQAVGTKANGIVRNPFNPSSPPIISIANNAVSFKDANSNNAIDAYEKSTIHFDVKNTGKGDGYNLSVKLSAKGNTTGITFSSSTTIPTIKAGTSYTTEIPVSASGLTENGAVVFTVTVDEPHGLGSDAVDIEISTKAFSSPLVKVVDYSVTGASSNNLARKQPFDLQALVQNTKQGTAENVTAEIKIPENILLISGEQKTSIGTLKAGATKEILYSLIVTDHYTSNSIPLTIQLKEKYGKYAEDKMITLNLNQALSTNKITVTASPDNSSSIVITEASLKSDVDKNIPSTKKSRPDTYVLAIGNEDYSSYQLGLEKEANVTFASNDAEVFAQYCEKTLGVPNSNISFLKNASLGQMGQAISKLEKLAEIGKGNAELIFYYAGHGLPNEETKESYLIPVDVSGSNIISGIRLNDLYNRLGKFPTKKVTVLLDACFSGGSREGGLVALRSVRVKPKEEAIAGNMVVFTSSNGTESSAAYKEKGHGMFTYYLLKKLMDSKGEATYKEMGDYLQQEVLKQSVLINNKEQTPQVKTANVDVAVWGAWKF